MTFSQIDSVSSFSDYGPVWALVGALLGVVWFLIRMLLAEKDKRIADAEKNRDELAAPVRNIGDSLARIEQKIRIAKGEE